MKSNDSNGKNLKDEIRNLYVENMTAKIKELELKEKENEILLERIRRMKEVVSKIPFFGKNALRKIDEIEKQLPSGEESESQNHTGSENKNEGINRNWDQIDRDLDVIFEEKGNGDKKKKDLDRDER